VSPSTRAGPIKAIDLFAGAGGSSRGAVAAGVKVAAAVDSWPLARDTYTTNFPDVAFHLERCEKVNLTALKKTIGPIDLLLASPECTSHTCAKGSAPRSEQSRQTAFQVVRFAKRFKPRWIVIENVVHMRSWKSYNRWLASLSKLGYNVREQVINAADHGVAQSRRRLFIMCDSKREPAKVPRRPGRKPSVVGVLKSNGAYPFLPLRKDKRAAATLERAERAMSAVGTNEPFLIVYYGSDGAGGWQRTTVPLRTLTTLDRFAYVRPTSDGHVMRMLQVPEIKLAMGFPANHTISHGTRREKIKLLGNAVCPPVMTDVLNSLTRPEDSSDDS
jgi:DNA (cytosine-5)-methyltransferase 1